VAERIYLSPPHMSGEELKFIEAAFAANWIAPVGPDLTAFEKELCDYVGLKHAVALSSGTAGIHLGLEILGVKAGDEVVVSDLTFIGSVNPVKHLGATPIFIDSEVESWNMSPQLLEDFLKSRSQVNRLPKAVILVHLYGQSADADAIAAICENYGIPLLEDSAEALGTRYKDRHAGTNGKISIFSFNGNKIITTSGGGMLMSDDASLAERARYLATQAREPAAHYEHTEIGYNYRLSNVLAGIGRGQLRVLPERIERKREIFQYYQDNLSGFPGIKFMPEAAWGRHTRWLSVITVEPELFGVSREDIRLALESENIESRPVWKPMHMQPVFQGCEFIDGGVSGELFENGLCLPSGTAISEQALNRIVAITLRTAKRYQV
jgi:dTDP-4-amino-4,6-dideoxygalactose transaminase